MAATPSYGDRPPLQGPQRSFTLPTRQLTIHEKAGLDGSDANEKTYFTHPKARVFKFKPPDESVQSTNRETLPHDTDYPVDAIETLPWRSRTEALLAAGDMVIEKVRGSGLFLKCQNVVHPIMRNSQCWCVDNESKFVLRVKAFEYYRIELPSQSAIDKEKVEELKVVLPKLLRYERTPCPFVRSFSVDLPDDAMTPRRKGTWSRRDSSLNRLSDVDNLSEKALANDRDSIRRQPPSSYPRNAPVFSSPLSAGRPGSSAGINDSSWSPFASRHTAEAHDSNEESENETDGLDGAGDADDRRGRTVAPRQVSAPVPVSVRIASIERSREPPLLRPPQSRKPLTVDIDLKKASVVVQQVKHGTEHDGLAQVPMSIQAETTQPGQQIVHLQTEHDQKSQNTEIENTEVETTASTADADISVREETQVMATEDKEEQAQHEDQPFTVDVEEHVSEDESKQDPVIPKEVSIEEEGEISLLPESETSAVMVEPEVTTAVDVDADTIDTTLEGQPIESEDKSIEVEASTNEKLEAAKAPIEQPDHSSPTIPSITENESVVESADAAPLTAILNPVHENPVSAAEAQDDEIEDISHSSGAEADTDDTISIVSSTDSFHTISSNVTQPDDMDAKLDIDETPIVRASDPFLHSPSMHKRGMSELTVTDTTTNGHISSGTSTPTGESIHTGLRQRLRARRSFSPMPPESTITTNPQSRQHSRNHDLAKAILQAVLVKPFEVALFIMFVLTRIVKGATPDDLWSGELFRRPVQRPRDPGAAGAAGQLDGNTDGPAENDTDGAQEDDYGVPLRGRQ